MFGGGDLAGGRRRATSALHGEPVVGAGRDDTRGEEEEEGSTAAVAPRAPAAIALSASGERGREKAKKRTEG